MSNILMKSFLGLISILLSLNSSTAEVDYTGWELVDPITTPWMYGSSGAYPFSSAGEHIAYWENTLNNGQICPPHVPATLELLSAYQGYPIPGIPGGAHKKAGLNIKEWANSIRFWRFSTQYADGTCSPINVTPPFYQEYESPNFMERLREVYCPTETIETNFGCLKLIEPICDNPSNSTVGNPCNPLTGNKSAREVDITGNDELSFVRSYHSIDSLKSYETGIGWHHEYSAMWILPEIQDDIRYNSYIKTGNGNNIPMRWDATSSKYHSTLSNNYVLEQQGNEWVLIKNGSARDIFNPDGRLIRKETPSNITYLNYINDQLSSVVDEYGNRLDFTYDANQNISTVSDTAGNEVRYEYDGTNNLITVIYPDLTPADNLDNPRKIYHYEDVDFPNHLTGITDENGDRYATYAYDDQGRAISTEHAQTSNAVPQEKYQLDYID